jgi:MFS superfamily sulfate permease-like transporter
MAKPQSTDRKWPLPPTLRGASFAGLGADLIAGLTLAAIAIPEQMATARLAGFPPQIGLYAFVAATIGFVVFGANRLLSAGADSTIAPIFAGTLAGLAATGTALYGELAAVLALFVGIILVFAGVFRLGWIADLLSRPVMTGFLAGISTHIVLSQAPAALGLAEGHGDVYERLARIGGQIGHANPVAAAVAVGVLVVTLAAERLSPRIPGALVALAGATAATAAFDLPAHGLKVLGALPTGLPTPSVPELHLETVLPLVGLATVVALVVMVQTAATTRSFSGGDTDPDVDRDFVGVGVGGVLAGAFGAFPVNASPPRTAAVSQAGGRTQIGGLAAALAVLLLAAFGGQLVADVPSAALAGVLLFVAQRIFHGAEFVELFRRTRAEFALAVLTTLLIFALPIQTGVAIGVFLSLAHGVFTITRARLLPFERAPGTTVWWPKTPNLKGETDPTVLVVGFQAPLSFLNAYDFRRDAEQALKARGAARLIVLEASSIVEIDFTAAAILTDVIGKARSLGVDVAVARLESVRAQAAFERFELLDLLGRDHLFRSVAEAIAALGAKDSNS